MGDSTLKWGKQSEKSETYLVSIIKSQIGYCEAKSRQNARVSEVWVIFWNLNALFKQAWPETKNE